MLIKWWKWFKYTGGVVEWVRGLPPSSPKVENWMYSFITCTEKKNGDLNQKNEKETWN